MMVKAVTKELRKQLESKLIMINGNKKLDTKIMNDFIKTFNLPIKLCRNIEELLSVLDLVINEVIKDKMGNEIVEFAKLESFRNSLLSNCFLNSFVTAFTIIVLLIILIILNLSLLIHFFIIHILGT